MVREDLVQVVRRQGAVRAEEADEGEAVQVDLAALDLAVVDLTGKSPISRLAMARRAST